MRGLAAVSAALVSSAAMMSAPPSAHAQADLLGALQPYLHHGELDVPGLKAAIARQQAAEAATSPPTSAPATEPGPADAKPPPGPPEVSVFLRDSFSDLHLFGKPSAAGGAKGASVSFSHDKVAGDKEWSLKGVVFVPIVFDGDYEGVLGFAIAPFAGVNLDKHSKSGVADKETYTYGLSGEIGWNRGDFYHYVRGRVGGVSDREKDQSDLNLTLEWLPIFHQDYPKFLCIGEPCGIPRTRIIYAIEPELKFQYDRASGSDHFAILSGKREAFRVGPEVTVNLHPLGTRLHAQATYHWAAETHSDQNYVWMDLSAGYNLDEAGHAAFTGSYSRGNDEDTGEFTQLYKISLTGKF